MKIRIEVESGLKEDEILIRCARVDDTVNRVYQYILDQSSGPKIAFYKDNREFFFPLDDVLFFQTEGERVYAHSATDSYQVKHRLYELLTLLPGQFARASKSAIVNTQKIHSITRNLAAASLVEFRGAHKHVYISRRYFNALRDRLQEGR